jgi:NAD(P)-dependent dehydrogenase (short-subunit alcohol dehydrogenase family)
MENPVTIVTGGSRGIGAATAIRLAAAGHHLVLSYLSDGGAAESVAGTVRDLGVGCVTVQADTSHAEDVDRLVEAAAKLGPVTGLVNNAGIAGRLGPLVEQTPEDLRRVVDVNVVGVLLCIRRAAMMMSAGAAIVNVSSAAATLGSPGEYVHYAASKAAVDSLTIGLSKELGPQGIRVNAVSPGMVNTDIHARLGDPDRAHRIGATAPLGRAAEPAEIAAAIAWLLSPDASYTTGAILRVAGGR